MLIKLTRDTFRDDVTMGVLQIYDDKGERLYKCETLEDACGDYGKGCAIKGGKYPIALTFSQRFQKVLPLVVGVENRSGIRIHAGNTNKDTTGCILVGEERLDSMLLRSRPALGWVLYYLQQAWDRGEKISILIEEKRNADGTQV